MRNVANRELNSIEEPRADQGREMSQRRVVAEKEIDDLLHLAGVKPSDERAVSWLKEALRGAEAVHRAARQRPLPADHNELLVDIAKHAKNLSKRLQRLQPSSWHAFWESFEHSGALARWMVEHKDDEDTKRVLQRVIVSGRHRHDRLEADDLLSIIKKIERAAKTAAKATDTGRPREIGKQRVVDLAFAFFVRYSRVKPSGTPTGAFAEFARAFYVAATKLDPERHGGLDRQIRQAVKVLPVERQRMARA